MQLEMEERGKGRRQREGWRRERRAATASQLLVLLILATALTYERTLNHKSCLGVVYSSRPVVYFLHTCTPYIMHVILYQGCTISLRPRAEIQKLEARRAESGGCGFGERDSEPLPTSC